MKIILLMSVITLNAFSLAIYGEDNRKDWYEISDNKLKELSLSTAVRVRKKQMYNLNKETYKFRRSTYLDIDKKKIYLPNTLGLTKRMCAGEKFSDQLAEGDCTGFLIADNKLLTAGHCVSSMAECRASVWIFDYKMTAKDSNLQAGHKKNVFSCKKILKSKQSKNWLGLGKYNNKNDYAIIELSRSTGRTPFKLSKRKPRVGTAITLVGYPSGLPLKVASGAKVKTVKRKVIYAGVDAFGGNSGSPVLDSNSLEVVGILTAGDADYKRTVEQRHLPSRGRVVSRRCNTVKTYNIDEARGENIMRVDKL